MHKLTWLLGEYIFYFPLITSLIWVIGGISYYSRMRHHKKAKTVESEHGPFVSVLVPARNEAAQIEDTIKKILDNSYKNLEILVINDSSEDNTKEIVERMMSGSGRIRLLDLIDNMGKATAINYALLACKGEIIVTIDADCSLERDCLAWMIEHFVKYPRVGAVTGNPRIKNRSTLIAQVQAAEYSSIIGLVKRSQRMLGKMFTVSGVIAAFRRRALLDAGLWSDNMLTEDIDITWKLVANFWDIRYEENARCGIVAPTTVRGLMKQRLRWSGGGAQVIRKYKSIWGSLKMRRMWPIYLDYILSVFWVYAFAICLCYWLLAAFLNTVYSWSAFGNPIPAWRGGIIACACLVQLLIGIMLNHDSNESTAKMFFYSIWFPAAYWFLQLFAVAVATPKGLLGRFDKPVKWISPERGIAGRGGRV